MIASESTSNVETKLLRLPRSAWGILIAGVVLRWGLQLLKLENLATDPDAYVRLSESLAAGTGFTIEGSQLPTAFRPPLFPVLLALPEWLGQTSIFSVAIVQQISSVLLLIATWKLAILVGLSQRFSVLALSAVACDPLLLLYATLPMTEVPSAAFLAWAIVYSMSMWKAISAGRTKQGVVSGILAGACFGLGGLCRPILFVACAAMSVVLFLAALWVLRKRGGGEGSGGEGSRGVAGDIRQAGGSGDQSTGFSGRMVAVFVPAVFVPAVVAAVVLSPWVIRNAMHLGHFVPATTHGGYTLLVGNNPVFYSEVVNSPGQPIWNGDSLNRWNDGLAQDMKRDGVLPSDEVGRDRWMYARAKFNIANDHVSFRNACLLRLSRFASLVPTASAGVPAALKRSVGVFYGAIALGLILQLCSMGKWCWGRQYSARQYSGRQCSAAHRSSSDRLPAALLWSVVLAFVFIHTFYWTNTRMRAPLMPVLIVLAALGFSWCVKLLKPRRRTSIEGVKDAESKAMV